MKNIYAHPDGWFVRLKRNKMTYSAFFGYGPDRDASLQRAIAARDEFYRLHGEKPTIPVRSNTGILGISEMTKWNHCKPMQCFQVTFGDPRVKTRRFPYTSFSEREKALQNAIACRRQMEAAHV
jgi:hypothetical protein